MSTVYVFAVSAEAEGTAGMPYGYAAIVADDFEQALQLARRDYGTVQYLYKRSATVHAPVPAEPPAPRGEGSQVTAPGGQS